MTDSEETPAAANFLTRREIGMSLWVSAHSPRVISHAAEVLRTSRSTRKLRTAARIMGMAKTGDAPEAFARRDAVHMTPGEFRDLRDFVRAALKPVASRTPKRPAS